MTYTFRNDTGGNTGVHRKLTVAEGDGNTLESKNRIEALEALTGKSISSVTSTSGSLTLHFTDSSTATIPLPIATFHAAGIWRNSHTFQANDIFSSHGEGIFLVLIEHTTDALPAVFDPAATDGTTENNPLYLQIGQAIDIDYDFAVSLPGAQLYDIHTGGGDLIAQFVMDRPVSMAAGLTDAQAWLETPTEGAGTDPTTLEISIEKNGAEIGTISFATRSNTGTFSFPAVVALDIGDRLGLRPLRADDAAAKDLSITLPAVRTDI